jgi:hypothetical protein
MFGRKKKSKKYDDDLYGDLYSKDNGYGKNLYKKENDLFSDEADETDAFGEPLSYSGRKYGYDYYEKRGPSTTRYYERPAANSVKTRYSGFGYSSGGGGWSIYKSSWLNEVEDDNSDLIVKELDNYVTPTEREIDKAYKSYRLLKKDQYDVIKELSRVCFLKMIDDKDYLKEEYLDEDAIHDDMKQIVAYKKALYNGVYENFIPGFSPLDQAISVFMKIQQEQPDITAAMKEGEDGLKNPFGFDPEVFRSPEIGDQLKMNEFNKDHAIHIMNKMSLIGNFGGEFKVEKECNEKEVANSVVVKKKMMRDHSQLGKIDLHQRLLPNFKAKMLTKDLTINVPIDLNERKQKIIVIIDYSGSMEEDMKQQWVNALLMDRFKYVMRGEAELFISFFVHDPSQMYFKHVKDRDSVMEFWMSHCNNPNGGMTDVGAMVERINSEVSTGSFFNLNVDLSQERPEILVINDGNDRVQDKGVEYKVNAVSISMLSPTLKQLCFKNGGKQIEIDYNNGVYSHTKSGVETINKGRNCKY